MKKGSYETSTLFPSETAPCQLKMQLAPVHRITYGCQPHVAYRPYQQGKFRTCDYGRGSPCNHLASVDKFRPSYWRIDKVLAHGLRYLSVHAKTAHRCLGVSRNYTLGASLSAANRGPNHRFSLCSRDLSAKATFHLHRFEHHDDLLYRDRLLY
jgi:hypothetical protein